MDRRAWQATVHGVAKSWTRLINTHFFIYLGVTLTTLCSPLYFSPGTETWTGGNCSGSVHDAISFGNL